METKFNLSKELQEILSEAKKITSDNKGKQVLLDTVIYCILERYINKKGQCDSLNKYLLSKAKYRDILPIVKSYHKDLTGVSIKDCHPPKANEMIDKVLAWFKESKKNNYNLHFTDLLKK